MYQMVVSAKKKTGVAGIRSAGKGSIAVLNRTVTKLVDDIRGERFEELRL